MLAAGPVVANRTANSPGRSSSRDSFALSFLLSQAPILASYLPTTKQYKLCRLLRQSASSSLDLWAELGTWFFLEGQLKSVPNWVGWLIPGSHKVQSSPEKVERRSFNCCLLISWKTPAEASTSYFYLLVLLGCRLGRIILYQVHRRKVDRRSFGCFGWQVPFIFPCLFISVKVTTEASTYLVG